MKQPVEFRFEFRMRRKDGNYSWILSVGRVTMRDDEGRPTRLIGSSLRRKPSANACNRNALRLNAWNRLGNWRRGSRTRSIRPCNSYPTISSTWLKVSSLLIGPLKTAATDRAKRSTAPSNRYALRCSVKPFARQVTSVFANCRMVPCEIAAMVVSAW